MVKFNCGCKSINDVCTTPICGQPKYLSVYAPVIYDEIGINLCRQITIPAEVIAANPSVNCVQLEVTNITFTTSTAEVPGTTVTTLRANCVSVTLTNVLITFNAKLFDGAMNYLDSIEIIANYLPANAASTDFAYLDSDTNPESVTVSLYAPYGVQSATEGVVVINPIALSVEANIGVKNGINATVYAKGMNFNSTTGTLSAGISIVLRTVYYEAYKLKHVGKSIAPKASTTADEGNVCLDFVEGGLLSREIKPLELEQPNCEQNYKNTETICESNGCMQQICNPCKWKSNSRKCNMDEIDCDIDLASDIDSINCCGKICEDDE